MLTFTLPATLTLYGDGSNTTELVDLPPGVRIEVEQVGFGWTTDFYWDEPTFLIQISPNGVFNWRLTHPDYETLLFTMEAITNPNPEEELPPEEGEGE